MLRISFFILLVIGLYSCADTLDCEREFDTAFVAEVGEEYCFPDGSKLLVTGINTSYCPCDAVCVWAGETVVMGTWTHITLEMSEIVIHEVLQDQNVPWASIHDIVLDESCEPEVTSLEIVISDPSVVAQCDEAAQIDSDLYDNGPEGFVNIMDASIKGDCLTISYSASGCSGDSWEVDLYDSGDVAESEPEQRYLRLSMNNPEACLAVFTKERSFDISNVQIANNGVLILNIIDFEESLRYEY